MRSLETADTELSVTFDAGAMLAPYCSATALRWLAEDPATTHRTVAGTLVFADISGFTPLTERLARRGKVGAEELTDVLNDVFGRLSTVVESFGGDLVKFGGDALLLLFEGPKHLQRAAACAKGLLTALKPYRRLRTPGGVVSLDMSVGLETGQVHLLLVGGTHRELLVVGPVVSATVAMEAAASAGQVLVGPAAARDLDPDLIGAAVSGGRLLQVTPAVEPEPAAHTLPDSPAELGVPVMLRAHLGAGREDGEHRSAALAFLQYRGTDALLESQGLAAVADAVDALIRQAQQAAEHHGVTFLATDVDRDGGKILLVAGAPVANPHDEDRLLLALRDAVAVEGPLQVRAGSNAGRAFAVDVGTASRRTYAVMGDATNLAARVMGRAEPGQVVATQALLDRLHGDFRVSPLEPFPVKGKSQLVSASVVGPSRGILRTADSTLPFVGRQEERSTLLLALSDARSGSGRVVVVQGDPGLGKSRLVSEFCSSTEGVQVVRVEGGQYAVTTPYFPLRAPLRALIGVGPDDSVGDGNEPLVDRLRESIQRVLPEAEQWLPLIAVMIGVDLPDTPEIAALDPAFRRTTAHGQAVLLMEQLLPGPLLFVVENAHLLDEASGELLDRLAAGVHDRRWLMCVMRRPVESGWRPSEDLAPITLDLGPLPAAESAALLLTVAGSVPLTPYARQALADRAGGNPLFLVELVGAVDDAGGIEGLPETLEGVIASGIDELARADRDVLRVAAVLGGVVDPGLLAAMLDVSQIMLPDILQRLWRFLIAGEDGSLRFANTLIRDVAYEGLPFRRRRALHARAGDAIAASHDPGQLADLLALHFHFADRPSETWQFATVAGERARHNSAPVEAARFYAWALAAAKELPGVPADEVALTAERQGDMLELAGRYDDAAAAFAAARRLPAADPLREVALLKKEGWVRERSGRYSAALAWYTRAMRRLDDPIVMNHGDATEAGRMRAQLLMSYGAARARQGRYAQSLPYLLEAAADAERLGDLPTLAHSYYLLDWALTDLGRPEAATYRELALPIYERLGDLVGQATVLNNLGIDAYYEGRWDEARSFYERSREVCRRSGNVVMDGTALNNIGEILSDQGRLDKAQQVFEEALTIWRSVRFPVGLALCLSNLGRVAARDGRFDEAQRRYAEARNEFRRIGADAFLVEVDAREGERLLLAGRTGDALRLAEAATERAEFLGGLPVVLAMLDRIVAQALVVDGDLVRARERLMRSRRRATEAGADYELAVTMHSWGRLLGAGANGDVRGDSEDMVAAKDILDRLGVVRVAEPSALSSRATPQAAGVDG